MSLEHETLLQLRHFNDWTQRDGRRIALEGEHLDPVCTWRPVALDMNAGNRALRHVRIRKLRFTR